jgi:hypothetical protein
MNIDAHKIYSNKLTTKSHAHILMMILTTSFNSIIRRAHYTNLRRLDMTVRKDLPATHAEMTLEQRQPLHLNKLVKNLTRRNYSLNRAIELAKLITQDKNLRSKSQLFDELPIL